MTGLHVSLATEPIITLGPVSITNSMLLGIIGVALMVALLVYTARAIQAGKRNYLTGIVSWAVEGMYGVVFEIIPDRAVAKKIAPLALTIFFTVLTTYWVGILPGVGSILWNGAPLLRGLPSDLNFTFALAIITIVGSQAYAIKAHGFFGNAGRYFVNPFKNPIGTFEGLLELVGEFSRLIALSLRLFGNAFAGEVLLMIIALLSGWFASLSLPFVMIFELFIGFIQAYVFFMLTLIFTSLAIAGHGDSHDAHPSDTQLQTSEKTT
jgi:F-type H+-transporting ATPase subunit a